MQNISELAKIDIGELIFLDQNQIFEQLAESVGYPLLKDIVCSVEGHEGDMLLLRVTGYVD